MTKHAARGRPSTHSEEDEERHDGEVVLVFWGGEGGGGFRGVGLTMCFTPCSAKCQLCCPNDISSQGMQRKHSACARRRRRCLLTRAATAAAADLLHTARHPPPLFKRMLKTRFYIIRTSNAMVGRAACRLFLARSAIEDVLLSRLVNQRAKARAIWDRGQQCNQCWWQGYERLQSPKNRGARPAHGPPRPPHSQLHQRLGPTSKSTSIFPHPPFLNLTLISPIHQTLLRCRLRTRASRGKNVSTPCVDCCQAL